MDALVCGELDSIQRGTKGHLTNCLLVAAWKMTVAGSGKNLLPPNQSLPQAQRDPQ